MTEHVYEETDVGIVIRERVTRCIDCESSELRGNQLWCTAPLGFMGYVNVSPDDFCSAGWPETEGK